MLSWRKGLMIYMGYSKSFPVRLEVRCIHQAHNLEIILRQEQTLSSKEFHDLTLDTRVPLRPCCQRKVFIMSKHGSLFAIEDLERSDSQGLRDAQPGTERKSQISRLVVREPFGDKSLPGHEISRDTKK
jgi:hypothetical protein